MARGELGALPQELDELVSEIGSGVLKTFKGLAENHSGSRGTIEGSSRRMFNFDIRPPSAI